MSYTNTSAANNISLVPRCWPGLWGQGASSSLGQVIPQQSPPLPLVSGVAPGGRDLVGL